MIYNTYDNLNRLRLVDRPAGELDVQNNYDNLHLVTSADQSGAHVDWAYDALGRLTAEFQSVIGGTVSHQYDPGGHWAKVIWPDGFWVQYDNNDAGEATAVRENGAGSGPGVLATFSFDDVGRPTNIYRGDGGHTGFGYDSASRLSALAHDGTAGGAATNQFFSFAYNPAGQIITRSASNPAYNWPYSTTSSDGYSVNGLNQYTNARGSTFSYDGRGNTTNDGTKIYTYDSSNRLTSASNGAGASYDATGRLASISLGGTTTRFLYDGTRLIGEYNGSGALLRRYVHGPGTDQPIVWYEGSGTGSRNWLYPDERGSIVGVEGPQGGGFKINKYDEYGVADAGNLGRFSYTGQTWLSEFGLHYYKARVYNASIGRFMQTDPIGYKDQMNLYGYVGEDPMNASDPNGLQSIPGQEASPPCLWCIFVPPWMVPKSDPNNPFAPPQSDADRVAAAIANSMIPSRQVPTSGPYSKFPWVNMTEGNSGQSDPVGDLINSSTPGRETKGRTEQHERGPGGVSQANEDFDKITNPDSIVDKGKGVRVGETHDGRPTAVYPRSSDGRPSVEVQDGKTRIKFRYDD